MPVTISPLDLKLDPKNPRFVVLARREQADIRKYMVTYEDVCQLAVAINEYGGLLPGERIVVLQEDGEYVVIEGNRRTCSLQLLLSRDLIPDGFAHRIPRASAEVLANCQSIEVDVLPNREAALELMTKRHIQGVREWKPLAKKQFFASSYNEGQGQSVQNISRITGISQAKVKEGIRDYKFFLSVYNKYCESHPDFDREIVVLKTDPFWRIFDAKFEFPTGSKVSPKDFFKISYDDKFNTVSGVPSGIFEHITQLVFRKTIVEESITTRNTLSDIEEIKPLLQAIVDHENLAEDEDESKTEDFVEEAEQPQQTSEIDFNEDLSTQSESSDEPIEEHSQSKDDITSGGPRPGGPPPRTFFETISWHGKLDPTNPEHQGLLFAVNELYGLSTINCGRQKAYKAFPIATGMVLRTVYEQALRLRLKQVNLWNGYCKAMKGALPTLKSMENFINSGAKKALVFPEQEMLSAYDRVIAATHRDFLNANVHLPGKINVTADSLESIAAGGMYALVQGIIDSVV